MNQYERELKEKGVTVYRAESGDTLASVAKKLGVSKIALQRANPSLPGTGPLPTGKTLLVFGADIGEQSDELALAVTEPDGRKQYVQTVTKSMPETGRVQQEIKQAQPQSEPADQQTIRIPNAVMTQEQLAALARAEIDPDFAQKEQTQRKNYHRALEDIRAREAENQIDYRRVLEDLTTALAAEQNDAVQNAVKRGLSQSSIPLSVRAMLEERMNVKRGREEEDHRQEMQKLARERARIGQDYVLKQEETARQYQAELQNRIAGLQRANDTANAQADRFNASGNQEADEAAKTRQYELTGKLLATVDRDAAQDYLKRHERDFKKMWGDDRYERLFARYGS